jgi:hypothetical protein
MPELTAELIADLPVPQDLDLSPDGRWVAYDLVPNSKKEEHPTAALCIFKGLAMASPATYRLKK